MWRNGDSGGALAPVALANVRKETPCSVSDADEGSVFEETEARPRRGQ